MLHYNNDLPDSKYMNYNSDNYMSGLNEMLKGVACSCNEFDYIIELYSILEHIDELLAEGLGDNRDFIKFITNILTDIKPDIYTDEVQLLALNIIYELCSDNKIEYIEEQTGLFFLLNILKKSITENNQLLKSAIRAYPYSNKVTYKDFKGFIKESLAKNQAGSEIRNACIDVLSESPSNFDYTRMILAFMEEEYRHIESSILTQQEIIYILIQHNCTNNKKLAVKSAELLAEIFVSENDVEIKKYIATQILKYGGLFVHYFSEELKNTYRNITEEICSWADSVYWNDVDIVGNWLALCLVYMLKLFDNDTEVIFNYVTAANDRVLHVFIEEVSYELEGFGHLPFDALKLHSKLEKMIKYGNCSNASRAALLKSIEWMKTLDSDKYYGKKKYKLIEIKD